MGAIKNAFRKLVKNSFEDDQDALFAGFSQRRMMNHFKADEYASAYPNVRTIATEFMTIQPYAIDANGKTVKASALNALYHPNRKDSSVAFFEKLAVMALTHRNTYILVHRRENGKAVAGGKITPENIAGYTFLEYPAVNVLEGRTTYTVGAKEYSEDEVIVIPGGVDPNDLYAGYCPGESSRRWAKVDDYIADYQGGFFENGAVPAGQFLITAKTPQDFNDIVDKMQAKHRGAGKNNNVTYSHVPVDPSTGKPAQAQIQWIPFAQSNKDIDFKNIFEQTNKRLDSTYGVPAIVKGVDSEATYANAQVAEATFAKRAVRPLALRIYTQITHELNRITNGLGVAITFYYEIPAVADEEYVRAKTKSVDADVIIKLEALGFTIDSIVDGFGLSQSYKELSKLPTPPPEEIDEADVDEGGEVNASPDPTQITNKVADPKTADNKAEELIAEGAVSTDPKVSNEIDETSREFFEIQLALVVRQYMQKQIDEAIEKVNSDDSLENVVNVTKEEKEEFVDEMLQVIVAVLVSQGAIEYLAGKEMLIDAGIATDNLTEFILSDKSKEKYKKYLKRVGQSYTDDTAESIKKVLAKADDLNWSKVVIESNLQAIMQTDEWRVLRLSTTEINRSQSLSGVEAMIQISDEEEVTIEKALLHTGGDSPCEFCVVILDKWVEVGKPLIELNETVVGEDGGIYVNDFVANECYDIHPNGHCTSQFRVVR